MSSKYGPCCSFVPNQQNPLYEHFKNFDAHLPVVHSIFFHYQPELYANRSNSYYPGIQRLAQRLIEATANFLRGKLGLVLAKIYLLNLNVARIAPFSGSAYTPFPKFLQNKKAIVNVQNNDNRCLGYVIAFALHSIQHFHHPT